MEYVLLVMTTIPARPGAYPAPERSIVRAAFAQNDLEGAEAFAGRCNAGDQSGWASSVDSVQFIPAGA